MFMPERKVAIFGIIDQYKLLCINSTCTFYWLIGLMSLLTFEHYTGVCKLGIDCKTFLRALHDNILLNWFLH